MWIAAYKQLNTNTKQGQLGGNGALNMATINLNNKLDIKNCP
jgi:hypothetical protein